MYLFVIKCTIKVKVIQTEKLIEINLTLYQFVDELTNLP